jgi:dTDP-glucose pyrophosphorylase
MILSPGACILDALQAIQSGGCAIAFICDASRRILGTVSDGDLRRAILAGASLESRCVTTVMNRDFAHVTQSAGRAEVLDMMRARGIEQVPILDRKNRLCGLHLVHELIGAVERHNWAVIMAGGKGKRLEPLTNAVPKPMLAVAGRPNLERLVLHLYSYGIRRIFLAVSHLAHVIENHFGDGSRFGCRIEYLRETMPGGTGGALSLLPSIPELPLIVVNGDLVTQFDVGRLLRFHAQGGYVATLGVRPYLVGIPFGVAKLRGARLVGLREKPTERLLINSGIYVLDPCAVRMVPPNREFHMPELLELCLRRKLKVAAHLIDDDWVDVGRHEELRRANGERER